MFSFKTTKTLRKLLSKNVDCYYAASREVEVMSFIYLLSNTCLVSCILSCDNFVGVSFVSIEEIAVVL